MPRNRAAGARRRVRRVIALLVLTSGCARHFDVPSPVIGGPPQAELPEQERATIVVPVSIAMSSLRAHLDSVFPPSDSLDRAQCVAIGGLVCHQYVYRRDTLAIEMRDDRVTLFTRLHIRARVALPGVGGIASCGYDPEPMRRAELRMATTLYWRSDWRLASRSTVLAPSILDPCEVTVLHVDATPAITHLLDAQMAHLRSQFDSIVPAVANLYPAADSMWQLMERPIALDSASSLWLSMEPDQASLAPLLGSGDTIRTAIALTAHPHVAVGTRPSADARPLPKLTLAGSNTGIHVPVEIDLPFDDLGKTVTTLLAGEDAGKGIRVHDVAIWGVGDTAVVKLDVSGRMSGALYLVGRVDYDDSTRAVLINDLRYTLASSSKMSSIKATLGASRIRHALDDATGHGHLSIGDQLDHFRTELGAELNRELAPGVTLSGSVPSVRIIHLYTTSKAFVLRVVFDGTARIDVH